MKLDFASEVSVQKGWNYDSAVVRKGALLYSWNVPARPKQVGDRGNGFVTCELNPLVPWNVALVLPKQGDAAADIVAVDDGKAIPAQPFVSTAAPVKLRVKGCLTKEVRWGLYRYEAPGTAVEPPPSPIRAPIEPCTLELVPLACTQTRITFFPWAEADDAKVDPRAKVYASDIKPPDCVARASYCFGGDSVDAIVDNRSPDGPRDRSMPRFTTWDHKGGSEWVRLDFAQEKDVSSVEVYWFDDGKGCAVPVSWRVQVKDASGKWVDQAAKNGYPVKKDCFVRADLAHPVRTKSLRIAFVQDPDHAAGMWEARVK